MNNRYSVEHGLSELPGRPASRKGPVPVLGALVVLVAIVAGIALAVDHAWANFNRFLAERGWGGAFTDPSVLFGLIVFGAEAVIASVFVKAGWDITVSEKEKRLANWIIFLLIAIGTIGLEAISWWLAPAGPPAWLIIVLLALFSFLILLGTAIWLWTYIWVAVRRWVCSVLVPWHFYIFEWLLERWLECAEWGVKTYVGCVQWAPSPTTPS